jgi:ribonuclease HII
MRELIINRMTVTDTLPFFHRMDSYSEIEQGIYSQGFRYPAGLDEAGRGPLAGPVVAAAVIFQPDTELKGVTDSKKLSAAKRDDLFDEIQARALATGIGICDHKEIDDLNILQASILAMHKAVSALGHPPDFLLVDGNHFHHPTLPFQTIVKGDSKCFSIAAASILAKVTRDRIMIELHDQFPSYGFAQHKGYPTKQHIDAIAQHGYSGVHRRSFIVKKLAQLEVFESQ